MSSIGFGTWAWGNKFLWGYQQDKDDDLLEKTFHTAISMGLTLIDTADSYGIGKLNGRSEKLLGKYLKQLSPSKLKEVTIATKLAPYPWRLGRDGLKFAFSESQKRLQGKLDRAQLHWSTSLYAPWQEVQLLDGLGDLFERGLIAELGISNIGPKRLRWLYKRLQVRRIPLKSIQVQFSLLSPEPQKYLELKEVCNEFNIELLAYSPLALGVLAVKPDSSELLQGTFLRKNIFRRLLPASLDLRKELNAIALYRGVTQAQVALNWCRAHEAIPLAGLRKPKHAIEAGEAAKWELSPKEKEKLDSLSYQCKVRMPKNPFQSS